MAKFMYLKTFYCYNYLIECTAEKNSVQLALFCLGNVIYRSKVKNRKNVV